MLHLRLFLRSRDINADMQNQVRSEVAVRQKHNKTTSKNTHEIVAHPTRAVAFGRQGL